MHRLLIAAASAALLVASATPVLAQQDYPPCTTPTQDHCREVRMGHHGHKKHHGKAHHHKGHAKHMKKGGKAPVPMVGDNPQH